MKGVAVFRVWEVNTGIRAKIQDRPAVDWVTCGSCSEFEVGEYGGSQAEVSTRTKFCRKPFRGH